MSASNYASCPRCRARAKRAADNAMARAQEAYGNVSAQEYEKLRDEAAALLTPKLGVTFREDYEIYGAGDGVVRIDYGGSCETCGLQISFNDEHPIPGIDEPASTP